MTATIELSYYPLADAYPDMVNGFLTKLRSTLNAEIHTNGMSTILIGPLEEMWPALGKLIESEFISPAPLFVIKIAPGRREYR